MELPQLAIGTRATTRWVLTVAPISLQTAGVQNTSTRDTDTRLSSLWPHPQTQDTNFTLSTISISTTPKNITIPQWSFPGAAAFQVLEGNLKIQIAQYPTASLSTGDVAFVPGNLTFKYWSGSYFTKFLFLSSGKEGLDQKLIQTGASYDYVTFPITW